MLLESCNQLLLQTTVLLFKVFNSGAMKFEETDSEDTRTEMTSIVISSLAILYGVNSSALHFIQESPSPVTKVKLTLRNAVDLIARLLNIRILTVCPK